MSTTANDSVTLPAASGIIATHLVGGKEHQVNILANSDGSLIGTDDVYILTVPPQAVGANKVYFDVFNATGSGLTLRIKSVKAWPNMDTAVTGTVGIQLFLTRTTAVGTGGTAIGAEVVTPGTASISRLDPGSPTLNASITARLAPTGGATAGAVLGNKACFTEETNAGTAAAAALGVLLADPMNNDIVVPQNTGFRIVQGAVASVGSIGFDVIFSLV